MRLVRPNKVKPRMWAPGRVRMGHPLARGLVGYWPFWEGPSNSTRLMDVSGNGKHGTLTDMDPPTDWVNSPLGHALAFDGANDYVDISDLYTIATVKVSGLTIACWLQTPVLIPNDGNKGIIGGTGSLGHAVYSAGGIYIAHLASNIEVKAVIHDGSTYRVVVSSSGDPVEGQWQHFVISLTPDDSKLHFYIDGVETGTAISIAMANLPYDPIYFFIARHPSYSLIDFSQAAVWTRGFSVAEIRELYEDPFGLIRPPSAMSLFMIGAVGVAAPAVFARSKVGANLAEGRGRLIA